MLKYVSPAHLVLALGAAMLACVLTLPPTSIYWAPDVVPTLGTVVGAFAFINILLRLFALIILISAVDLSR